MKKIFLLFLMVVMTALILTACSGGGQADASGTSADTGALTGNESTAAESEIITAPTEGIKLSFEGDNISCTPETDAVSIAEKVITVRAGGEYTLSGSLEGGRILVEAPKTEVVTLVFDSVSIKCDDNAPIYVKSCDKVKIVLSEGSENALTDGAVYRLPEGEDKPNACLYSSEDIDIEGSGTLTVNGNYNNGIGSKNDIDIEGGSLTVNAPNNAIKGNDSVTVKAGKILITGADDGIKSDTEGDTAKGFISIEGGEISITADDDAIQASTSVSITAGSIVTNAGGKAINCDGNITLAEGILTEN